MRALVLGAGGLLGSELMKLLTSSAGLSRSQLSVTDLAAINAMLNDYRPDVVFNCAAYNAVDTAEGQPDLAYQVNAQGALNVAIACAQLDVRLVYFSTNFVFDGMLDRPYLETDEVGPLSVYAKSKLEGEKLTSMLMPRALIIRTSALFGGEPGRTRLSFPERVLEHAAAGDRLRVVSDQKVNPTSAADLAAAAIGLASSDVNGVVHMVGGGCAAWDELARATLEEFGVAWRVEPMSTAELGAPAPRPPNGCLGSTRTQPLRHWQEALKEWAGQRTRARPEKP